MTSDIRRSILYVITLSFLTGVGFRSFYDISIVVSLWFFVIALGMLLMTLLLKAHTTFLYISISVFSFVAGTLLFNYAENKNSTSQFHQEVGNKIELKGVVVEEPEPKTYSLQLVVKEQETQEKMLVQAPMHSAITFGDKIQISGEIVYPKNFVNEIGREVLYRDFLKKDGIQFEIKKAKIEFISSEHLHPFLLFLYDFKQSCLQNLRSSLPEPDSSLAGGILLGEKESLGKALTEDLRNVGLIHVVVLSGYNIAIVVLVVQKIGNFVSRNFSLILSFVGIILFVLFVGGEATVIRASVMACLALSTQFIGRSYDAGRALLVAALIMVVWNPYILMFDMSFQLSFLATLGIVYLTPILSLLFPTDRFEIVKTILVTTISTQISVAPFLLFSTGSLSTIGLVTNMLVLPFIPLMMGVSFLVVLGGFVNTLIVFPISFITHMLFSYMLWVVEVTKNIPTFTLSSFSFIAMCFLYVVLITSTLLLHRTYLKETRKI